jgi:hypothetical protein
MMFASRWHWPFLSLAALVGCAEPEVEPCDGDVAFPKNEADYCGYWCPHATPKEAIGDAVVCGREETCTRGKCEAMRERPLWPLPSQPPNPGNYETDGAVLLDKTTGLRFKVAPEVQNRDDATTVCEKLKGNFRLPQWIELMTIVDYSGRDEPRLIEPFDPAIPSVYYWWPIGRDYSNLRQQDPEDPLRWLAALRVAPLGTSGLAKAICVESTRPESQVTERFLLDGETVLDLVTGLRWQAGASEWSGPMAAEVLADPAGYCETLGAGGFSEGWRVPNLLELFSLRYVDGGLDPAVFAEDDVLGAFGSSTPAASAETNWNVTFSPYELTTSSRRIRCVRGPE